ncbi:hypothetical protein [Bacillus thuringiensis]|uniref:hypothetical protein n=1 Tax=Bacillus thuringiensis TaxID=1428 RepID=UPI000BF9F7BA|nr:hypothetical protein [Bacillus thuringiensis]PFU61953.1 hypothetical protein COK85_10050 [Bacillus thuringiensis]
MNKLNLNIHVHTQKEYEEHEPISLTVRLKNTLKNSIYVVKETRNLHWDEAKKTLYVSLAVFNTSTYITFFRVPGMCLVAPGESAEIKTEVHFPFRTFTLEQHEDDTLSHKFIHINPSDEFSIVTSVGFGFTKFNPESDIHVLQEFMDWQKTLTSSPVKVIRNF